MKVIESIEVLCQELLGLRSALVVSHIHPDPDAVSSAVGLVSVLRRAGIEAGAFLSHKPPATVDHLLGDFCFAASPGAAQEVPDSYDALIAVDTASRRRVGDCVDLLAQRARRVIVIDHHVSNTLWGDVNYVDPTSAATAEIVYAVLECLGQGMTAELASLLYAGILDDTGCFCYSNTSPRALSVASALVASGASPSAISSRLYATESLQVLQFRAACAGRLRLLADGQLAFLPVDAQLMRDYGVTAENTEGLVDIGRSLSSVKVSVFAREYELGWKLSLRSKDNQIDVNQIAGLRGGGGHKAAAGCTISEDFSVVESFVLNDVVSAIVGAK